MDSCSLSVALKRAGVVPYMLQELLSIWTGTYRLMLSFYGLPDRQGLWRNRLATFQVHMHAGPKLQKGLSI